MPAGKRGFLHGSGRKGSSREHEDRAGGGISQATEAALRESRFLDIGSGR